MAYSSPRVTANFQNSGQSQTSLFTLAGTQSGDLIIVGVSCCQDSGCGSAGTIVISNVSDGVNNYTPVPNTLIGSGGATAIPLQIWWGISGGGDLTITITASSSAAWYVAGFASAWAGASASPADTVGNNATGGDATISVSTSGSTAVAGELIYSFAFGASGTTDGQTPIQGTANRDEYQVAGAPGIYTNTFTGATLNWGISIAAFLPSAPTGTPVWLYTA